MSSIPTQAQQQALPQTIDATSARKQDLVVRQGKSPKFIRSASIERIIQFNSYICSQNYFLIPSLLMWLKSSQTVLQSQILKCIVCLKSIVISSVIYKLFANQFKTCMSLLSCTARDYFYKISNSDLIPALEMLYIILHHSVNSYIGKAKRKLFVLCMYLAFLLIFLQLGTCIFLMSEIFLPAGLIFLFTCLYIISHINVSVLFHYLKREENKLLAVRTDKKPKKFILGKKTISNLNLF